MGPIKRHWRGFTLLEMLLTLVVIAVMATLVSVSVGTNPYNTLEREAKRLQAVLQMAADDAVLQGVQWSLALSEQGYQLLVFNSEERQWEPVQQQPFSFYPFDSSVTQTLTVEGLQLDPQALEQMRRMQSLKTQQSLQPALLLLSSGEITPFRLTLYHDQLDGHMVLHSDGVSVIRIDQQGVR